MVQLASTTLLNVKLIRADKIGLSYQQGVHLDKKHSFIDAQGGQSCIYLPLSEVGGSQIIIQISTTNTTKVFLRILWSRMKDGLSRG